VNELVNYGPWAVIAGGSEGVGAEFARQLAAAGLNLVLLARKPGPLEVTAESCRGHGVEVRTIAVDLVDPDGADRLFQATADIEIGLLIYNAGASTCSAANWRPTTSPSTPSRPASSTPRNSRSTPTTSVSPAAGARFPACCT
jgi:short-subunit dehydrogenase